MKKLIFLIFPLAFFIGFMPYFLNTNEVQVTSTMPKIVEEDELNDENELLLNEIQEQIEHNVELLALRYGIIEDATILTNNGIQNI